MWTHREKQNASSFFQLYNYWYNDLVINFGSNKNAAFTVSNFPTGATTSINDTNELQ